MRAGGAAGVLAAVLIAACAVRAAPPVEAETATLTPAAPTARLALAPPPAHGALLEVDVIDVHNPARVPVTIDVALSADADAIPHGVMRFALFPADQPGRFVARADVALARAAAAAAGPPQRLAAQVTLQLVDGDRGGAAAQVRVRLRIRWLDLPPQR